MSRADSAWPLRNDPNPSSACQGGIRSPRISSRIDCVQG